MDKRTQQNKDFFNSLAKDWDAKQKLSEYGVFNLVKLANINHGDKVLDVACGTGVLQIVELQAPGSKRMNARDYLRGKPMQTGTVLGGSHAE